ncbi:MAG: hypothetical protein KC620_14735, partial [Myxococcales bacterium]|nr:hypothetical protein [Myxococcales bacterium]
MAKHAVDKKLEGRLFDLLEARTRIRLGQLVQIRRRARDRGRTMLQVALDAGLVEPVLARRLAQEAGLPDPFEGEEQNISNSAPSDDSMSDSMFDSMVDAPPDVARRTRGSAPPSVSPPEGARRARASAPPAGSPPPMPILRAPPA